MTTVTILTTVLLPEHFSVAGIVLVTLLASPHLTLETTQWHQSECPHPTNEETVAQKLRDLSTVTQMTRCRVGDGCLTVGPTDKARASST